MKCSLIGRYICSYHVTIVVLQTNNIYLYS